MIIGIKDYAFLKICFILLFFLVLLGCNSSNHSEFADDSKTIATVNGEPIVEAEYRLAQNIPSLNIITQHDQILERIVQVKLIQLEGIKYGLLPSASSASFLTRFNKENKRRAQALEQKQVIYGPRQYTEGNYYNDEFSRLETSLKEVLSKNSMDLSEKALRQQYESSKQEYTIQPTIVLKALIEPIQSDSSVDLSKAAEITINEANKRDYMKYREDFFIKANELQVGQFSNSFIDQEKNIKLYCISRIDMGYKTFNEVRDELYLKAMAKQFQVHIKGLRESAKVQLKPEYDHLASGLE